MRVYIRLTTSYFSHSYVLITALGTLLSMQLDAPGHIDQNCVFIILTFNIVRRHHYSHNLIQDVYSGPLPLYSSLKVNIMNYFGYYGVLYISLYLFMVFYVLCFKYYT